MEKSKKEAKEYYLTYLTPGGNSIQDNCTVGGNSNYPTYHKAWERAKTFVSLNKDTWAVLFTSSENRAIVVKSDRILAR